VCRMEDDRGLELLQEVVRQSRQHHYTFCGDGPRRAALQAAIPEARFLGHVSQTRLAELRRDSDVFLHASTTDTYSEAVVEAMAAGLAVIATNVGGPVGYLVDGENGLTRPADPDAWSQALQLLASSAALRTSLGVNAMRTVAGMPWSGQVDAVIAALAPGAAPGIPPSFGDRRGS
jgi:phosphatidylinositol alpha 1,6-mannosyltransferase